MPRSGVNGTYNLPAGTDTQAPNTTISSSMFNGAMDDIEQTFNTATPIAYGGTGSTTAATARDALGVKNAVVNTVEAVYTLSTGLGAIIPIDDTIPQNTEGTYIISLPYSAKFANSKLELTLTLTATNSTAPSGVSAYIGSSSIADAFAASRVTIPTANYVMPITVEATYFPGSTSSVTYVASVGPSAGTAYLNGSTSGRTFGGRSQAVLRIREIAQ